MGSAWGTMLAVGAALGGLVVTLFGRDAAISGNASRSCVSAWLLLAGATSVLRGATSQEHPGVVEATRETIAYARRDHRVLALIA